MNPAAFPDSDMKTALAVDGNQMRNRIVSFPQKAVRFTEKRFSFGGQLIVQGHGRNTPLTLRIQYDYMFFPLPVNPV